jgi:hypothetical protein
LPLGSGSPVTGPDPRVLCFTFDVVQVILPGPVQQVNRSGLAPRA